MANQQPTGKQSPSLDKDMGKQTQKPAADTNRAQQDSDFETTGRQSSDTTSAQRPATSKQQSDSSVR